MCDCFFSQLNDTVEKLPPCDAASKRHHLFEVSTIY